MEPFANAKAMVMLAPVMPMVELKLTTEAASDSQPMPVIFAEGKSVETNDVTGYGYSSTKAVLRTHKK
jgi:hypothetical protein